ncbi:hypothetical protein LEP1GSC061_3172 [Leptospira wolffii serovar Khorat str. Khorat-H2]|nr:hypothetical protein LEP1GSC061_3172 [Leptospira wolffii serovar Khorat str. Khorat-H2]
MRWIRFCLFWCYPVKNPEFEKETLEHLAYFWDNWTLGIAFGADLCLRTAILRQKL